VEPGQIFGAIVIAAWLTLLAAAALLLYRWRPDQPEWSRKL